MKLKIEHLAHYLPYRLKFIPMHYNKDKKQDTLYYISTISNSEEFRVNGYTSNYIKPILRPLSDLAKEITVNGETFVPINEFYSLTSVDLELINIEEWHEELVFLLRNDHPFQLIQFNMLFEWHFDIFGLIEQGLAIDINTLNK